MSSPKQRPDPNSPHAGRSEKMRNAKGAVPAYGVSTAGIGEAPSSRLKKYGIIFAVAMIILFLIMDVIDRANVKKAEELREQRRQQTSSISADENAGTIQPIQPAEVIHNE